MKRREMLGAGVGAAAGLVLAEPWQRLAHVLERGGRSADTKAIEAVDARTAELYDLEERLPSHRLGREVGTHLDGVTTLLADVPNSLRPRLVANAGAAAALAGWLAFDCEDTDTAARYYDIAERAAREAGEGPLLACVLTYRSYLATSNNDPTEARVLLRAAQEHIRPGRNPAMLAWMSAREAEESTALGDRDGALRAMERARTAYEYATPSEEALWTGFFTSARLGGMAVATYARLGHPAMDLAVDELLTTADGADRKVQAIAMGDVSSAYLYQGDLDRGASFARRASEIAPKFNNIVINERFHSIRQALLPYGDAQEACNLRTLLSNS